MKKLILLVIAIFLVPTVLAGGWDEFGYNYNAHTFKNWYDYRNRDMSQTGDAWLLMKWYEPWDVFVGVQRLGAQISEKVTYYTDDYSDYSYGWDNRADWTDKRNPPETTYKLVRERFAEKMYHDPELWLEYNTTYGVYGYNSLTYDGIVPQVWVLEDTIKVYMDTGKVVEEIVIADAP